MVANLQLQLTAEQRLLRGCLSGQIACQKLLYQEFAPAMFSICLRYAGNFHTAEDILQEGFLKVFQHLDSFRGSGSFEGWIKRIFIHTALEFLRKQNKRHGFIELQEHLKAINSSEALHHLRKNDLLNMISRLPLGYRTVFNLYAIEGYTHPEISKILEISVGTSKSQLSRARKLLQQLIIQNP